MDVIRSAKHVSLKFIFQMILLGLKIRDFIVYVGVPKVWCTLLRNTCVRTDDVLTVSNSTVPIHLSKP